MNCCDCKCKKRVDITENVAAGDVAHLISVLKRYQEIGFDRLYWDGYDSAIYLYKLEKEKV